MPSSQPHPSTVHPRDVEIRFLDVCGYRIRTAVWPGEPGGTPLLMFNGIGGRVELLAPLAAAMPGVEIITFEVPGAGESPTPLHYYSMGMLASLSERLLDQLGYQRVDVLGLSWGGTLAQEFARQHRFRCRRLVLVATLAGLPVVSRNARTLLRLCTPRRFNDPIYRRRIAGEIYGGAARTDPDLVAGLDKRMGGASTLGYLLQLAALQTWPGQLGIGQIRQPTLVIAGDDDPIIPLVNARWMARRIRNSRLEVVRDGHLFFISDPALTSRLVRDFLAEADAV